MNVLERYLETMQKTRGINPIDAMNRLQDAGIVSDNCITAADVPDSEAPKAIEFLRRPTLPPTHRIQRP